MRRVIRIRHLALAMTVLGAVLLGAATPVWAAKWGRTHGTSASAKSTRADHPREVWAHPGTASLYPRVTRARSRAAALDTTATSAGTSLVGTFRVQAGSCSGGESGSYFRMVEAGMPPGGSDANYLTNSNSTCSDQTYTLFQPGSGGGLVTGGYQPGPSPEFDGSGNALAAQIVQPETFFGVKFSVTTQATDPQSNQPVPEPSVVANGSTLSGNLEAWSAAWNNQYFNQGAPKPGGSSPGFTGGPTGTYDSSTGAYTLNWTSQIVGGPFNNFTGQWHLVGTFVPTPGSSSPPPTSTEPTTTPASPQTTAPASPPTTGTTGTGTSGGSGTSSTGASGSTGGTAATETPAAPSGSAGATEASTSGTLAFTGLPIPLWLPLPVLGLGAALMMPTRRSSRVKRSES